MRARHGRLLVAVATAVAVLAAGAAALLLTRGDPKPPLMASASASALHDSVGVNVHLTYFDSAYAEFDRVRAGLRALGVRHVRDVLEPTQPAQRERLRVLAGDGIRATLVLGPTGQDVRALTAAARELAPVLAGLEGPNEPDKQDDPGWADALRTHMRTARAVTQADPALRRLPFWGPSVVEHEARRSVADLTALTDGVNLHPYPAGRAPEGTLPREVARGREVAGGKPLIATELGYHNAFGAGCCQPAVGEGVAGDYAPRALLAAFAAGVRRTFWYELVDAYTRADVVMDASFGLLRRDFTPKPSFTAIANLLRLARDDGPAPRRPVPEFTVHGGVEDVRQLVLQRSDGTDLLALWRPVELPDERTRLGLDRAPAAVRVELPRPARSVTVHRPSRSAAPTATLADVEALEVPLAGDVTVVRVRW